MISRSGCLIRGCSGGRARLGIAGGLGTLRHGQFLGLLAPGVGRFGIFAIRPQFPWTLVAIAGDQEEGGGEENQRNRFHGSSLLQIPFRGRPVGKQMTRGPCGPRVRCDCLSVQRITDYHEIGPTAASSTAACHQLSRTTRQDRPVRRVMQLGGRWGFYEESAKSPQGTLKIPSQQQKPCGG